MSKESKLIKNTIIYAIGNFSTKVLTFLIVPLYTHYISTEDMGVYDLIVTTITFLMPVITFQLTDGIYRWLLDPNVKSKEVIKAGFTQAFINIILTLLIGYPIISFFKIKYGILMIGMLITQSLFSLLQQTVRGLKKNHIYVISGIIHTAVFLGLNILQIVVMGQGIVGLMVSQIVSSLCGAIFIIFVEKNIVESISVKLNKRLTKEMLLYSLPLIPNTISWSAVNMSDRYIIRYFIGNSANGIYSISYKFPAVVQIFTNFFYMAWQESSISEYRSEDRDKYYSDIFEKYYKFLFTLIVALMPVTQVYVVYTMDSNYHTAWIYTGFLYLGTVFSALSSFLGTGYQSSKESMGAFTTTVIAAIVNAGVNIFTIKYLGLQAAALSTFISYLILFIIRIFHTRKYFKLDVNWVEFWGLASAATIAILLYVAVNSIIFKVSYEIIGITIFLLYNKNLMVSILSTGMKFSGRLKMRK